MLSDEGRRNQYDLIRLVAYGQLLTDGWGLPFR